MASRLADGLATIPGARLAHPVEANELFPHLPEPVIAGLERDGFGFYRWPGPDPTLLRLVTAFDTEPAQVDAFLASARRHAGAASR
jgi:threonine aldolase